MYFSCCSIYCLFCVVLCIVCVYMCTVLLPPGGYPIAVNKYISYHLWLYFLHLNKREIISYQHRRRWVWSTDGLIPTGNKRSTLRKPLYKYHFVHHRSRTELESYRTVNTLHLGYKNQSLYALWVKGRCLFGDRYTTHKLRGLSPRANYTDRAAAAGRRS